MKRLSAGVWSNFWIELLLGLVFLAAVGVLWRLTYCGTFTLSESIQVGTLFLLISVTTWYAISTRRIQRAAVDQAEATQSAVQVALDSERNAVMPIVELKIVNGSPRSLTIVCRNVGNGPALNLRVLANFDSKDRGDEVTIAQGTVTLVGARDTELPRLDANPLPSEIADGFFPLRLVGQYSDIYGRRFRSTTYTNTSRDLRTTYHLSFSFQPLQ